MKIESIVNNKTVSYKPINKGNFKSVPIKSVAIGAGLVSAACLAGQVAAQKSKGENSLQNKPLDDSDIRLLFEKHHYVKNDCGDYRKQLSPEEWKEIQKSNDMNVRHNEKLRYERLYRENISEFKDFLNLANGKAIPYVDKFFDNLVNVFISFRNSKIIDRHIKSTENNPAHQDLVLDVITRPTNVLVDSYLMNYKTDGYHEINDFLRCKHQGKDVCNAVVENRIKVISDYLDTQEVKGPIKAYRTEGFSVLSKVKINDTQSVNLKAIMNQIDNTEDKTQKREKLLKLKEFVLDNEIKAHQPSFLSTSLREDLDKFFGLKNVVWEFNIPKGTKGVYIEAMNSQGIMAREDEFLIQKGSTITINSIDYDFEKNLWKLKADVSHDN